MINPQRKKMPTPLGILVVDETSAHKEQEFSLDKFVIAVVDVHQGQATASNVFLNISY